MAAGTSSRFAPLSYETHKSLLTVRGEVLIERQIRQIRDAGIDSVVLVGGYMKERFAYLREKFGVTIVDNPEYTCRNNHSSIYAARHLLGNSYICSSDNYFSRNPFESCVDDAYYAALYADDFDMIRMRATFVLRVKFTENRVGYIYTTRDELAATGLDSFTASRGMVGVMSDVRGVNIWVNFTETDAGVLCEIRSNKYNINPVAVKYGGGGHAMASGATLPDHKTAIAMLADLDAMMKEDDRK